MIGSALSSVIRPRRMSRAEYLSRRTEFARRGQELPHAKLLDLQVIAIRSAARQREALKHHIRDYLSNAALARLHGVHVRTIEKVLSREGWSHLQ